MNQEFNVHIRENLGNDFNELDLESFFSAWSLEEGLLLDSDSIYDFDIEIKEDKAFYE